MKTALQDEPLPAPAGGAPLEVKRIFTGDAEESLYMSIPLQVVKPSRKLNAQKTTKMVFELCDPDSIGLKYLDWWDSFISLSGKPTILQPEKRCLN